MKLLPVCIVVLCLAPPLVIGQTRGLQNQPGDPFVGITTDGSVTPGLFTIRATGVSTEPLVAAANEFLKALTDAQRSRTVFPVGDAEWRKWDNRHRSARQGISFQEMSDDQRAVAFGLLSAGLSARGLQQTRDIMKLNGTLAELTSKFDEYGEWLYWMTLMGTPSMTEPWGWQFDGHHCVINYFVLGDQVVMTPTFMGSEPIRADSGRFAGTVVLQGGQNQGLGFMRSLTATQQHQARIQADKTGNNNRTEAYRDNVVLDYAGISGAELDADQRQGLLALVREHVGTLRDDQADEKMSEVEAHLDQTWFAWVGGIESDAVFYYRVHSPVILIEFDHQRPVALGRSGRPSRNHAHSVVRTPNGNDYGKDLLRQHLQEHPH